MDAGHFDTKTAYAAANTLRLDDMNPHFWRTHDGGKTWTEIDNGIAAGAVGQLHPRRPAQERAPLCRHRYPGLGLLRRWRQLAVAAAEHARHLRARHRSQGRCLVHVLRSGGRHARPRLLDSRRRDPAAPGCRSRRGVRGLSCSSPPPASAFASAPTIRRPGRRNCRPARTRRPAPSSTTTCPSAASEVKLEILNPLRAKSFAPTPAKIRCAVPTRPPIPPPTTSSARRLPPRPIALSRSTGPRPQQVLKASRRHAPLQLGHAL